MPSDPNTRLGADRITSNTLSGKAPWEELLGRFSTVPAAKIAQASAAVQGMAGSWAGSWVLEPTGIRDTTQPLGAAPIQAVPNMLGRMGMAEVNYVPYSFNTNRFGNKGGALLGSPISFSVVGPTVKNRRTIWQWVVDNNKAAATDPDVLTLDTVEAISVAGLVAPGVFNPAARGIEELYGIDPTTFDDDFPGGLYLIVTMSGAQGELDGDTYIGDGGIGDGFINTAGGRVACAPLSTNAPYEIFRVASVSATEITLATGKYLSDYFSIPTTPTPAIIRSIMLVQPSASRCVMLPGSEGTAFAILPPERTLVSDQQYPQDDWTGGAFVEELTSWTNTTDPAYYNTGPLSPIPKPLTYLSGRLDGISTDAGTLGTDIPGHMVVWLADPSTDYAGKLMRIREVTVRGDAELAVDPSTGFQAELTSLLGYFEFIEILSTTGTERAWLVRRIDEVNPLAGRALFGSDQMFALEQSVISAGDTIQLDVSIHNAVSTLWTEVAFDYDALDSARIKNLLDPRWVERSTKVASGEWPGTFPNRAEKAIFDTSYSGYEAANPGSLYDLGFKVVLYPATISAGNHIVPDWDRPVSANGMTLGDASSEGIGYAEVDYANGIVRLSQRAGDAASPLYTDLAVLAHAENPRREPVIFASCVPYTMESGQIGTGTRVSGSSANTASPDCLDLNGGTDFADPYGARTMLPLANSGSITSYYDGGAGAAIILDGHYANEIPMVGFVEILQGPTPLGDPVYEDTIVRATTWGYFGVRERTVGPLEYTDLLNPFGGALPATPPVLASGHKAILRRHTSIAWGATGEMLTKYQYDTVYGQAVRGGHLRFEDAEVRHNIDGSVTIAYRNSLGENNADNFEDLVSSWILSGGATTVTASGGDLRARYAEMVVLVKGRRYTVLADYVQFTPPATPYAKYLYVDTAGSCPSMALADALPLVAGDYDKNHILIAKYYDLGAGPLVQDMRYPLVDFDQRADIYVGNVENMESDTPYFTTLADAVAYASEIQTPQSGTPGRRIRIRVVGYTEEAAADLPIQINTDGLVIEGDPRISTDKVAVSWDAETSHLIDLNGHHDLTFQGVPFDCKGTTTPATGQRAVFTNTSVVPCERVEIHNCRVDGTPQGFLYIDGTGGLIESSLTRNYVEAAKDFGIILNPAGTLSVLWKSRIEENIFIQDSAVGAMATQYGIWVNAATTASDPNQDNSIKHNNIQTFQEGIRGRLTLSFVERNRIEDTVTRGIFLDYTNRTQVVRNQLIEVYTEDPVVTDAEQRGLYVSGGNGAAPMYDGENIVDHNYVDLASDGSVGAPTPYAIYCEDGAGNPDRIQISNNDTGDFSIFSDVSGSSITENSCDEIMATGSKTTLGKNNAYQITASGNNSVVEGNFASSGILVSPTLGSTVTGNIITEGTLGIGNSSQGVIVQGNYSLKGPLSIGTACTRISVLGNILVDGAYTVGAGTEKVVVEGNHGSLGIQVDHSCSSVVISDNTTDASITTYSSARIIGNHVDGDINLGLAATYAAEASTVLGNYVKGDILCPVGAGSDYCAINGNRILGGSILIDGERTTIHGNVVENGIQLYGSASYSSIMGNTVEGAVSATFGIRIDSGSNHCTVVGNTLEPASYDISLASNYNIVNGNRAHDIIVGGTQIVVVGNNVNALLPVGAPAGTPPAGTVYVGNYIADAVTGEFGGAPTGPNPTGNQ